MINSQSTTFVAASNQFASAADSVTLSITGNITLECWVKFTGMPADRALMISKPNDAGSGYDAYHLELNKNGANYDLRGHTDKSGTDQIVTYASWNPSLATWYHVAYTRDSATGVQKLYVDGTEVVSATNTGGASNNSTHPLYLGRFGTAVALNLNGQLDDIRVWNVIRTQTQINNNKSNHITEIIPNFGINATLIAYYTFAIGSEGIDSSGNSNTLISNTGTVTTDVPFQEGLWDSTNDTIFNETFSSLEILTFFVKVMIATATETFVSSEPIVRLRKNFTNIQKSSSPTWTNNQKS